MECVPLAVEPPIVECEPPARIVPIEPDVPLPACIARSLIILSARLLSFVSVCFSSSSVSCSSRTA